MDIAIHTNASLAHQVKYAEHLKAGFDKHGLKASITGSVNRPADLHIVIGPWYAKQTWLGHPRTILIDRALYKEDPHHVSAGWMTPTGNRLYRAGSGKTPPEIKEPSDGTGSIFLGDFNGPLIQADTVRLHPAHKEPDEPLVSALRRHRRAVGYKTTALVTAALEGLEVESREPEHILNQGDWLNLLPWADWHFSEIENGDLWEHLRQ